ncbi:hypothetical protein M3Y94_01257900 [Aphelenchoides besseyi]|nr:hypothetical protein M3Y94_01257900 [Aphelenchoides besseyi]KAI6222513.1 hypothetical protein M3Y95_00901400 [Aphelenchoides besseyi]
MAAASSSISQPSSSLFQTPKDDVQPGTLVLAPYKKQPLWPSVVRRVTTVKQKSTVSIFYLPLYSGDKAFKFPISKLTIFKPEMELPDNGDEGLDEAYKMARNFYTQEPKVALDHCLKPPLRPKTVKSERKPKSKPKPKTSAPKDYVDTDEEIHSDDDASNRLGEELVSGNEETEESDEEVVVPPPSKRARRHLLPNEVIFKDAKPTKYESKDQVILIQNPNGPGLWPAQPVVVSEEKGFANFVVFPRQQQKSRTRRVEQLSTVIRTCDTRMYALNEERLNAMLVYVKDRDEQLQRALEDVRSYMTDNHRLDAIPQVMSPPFKDIEVFAELPGVKDDGESNLSLDELTLNTSTGERMTTRNHESLIHKIPRRRAQEVQRLRANFATARESGDTKPIWLIKHRVYVPHSELTHEQLIGDDVKEHFESIWSGNTTYTPHQQFLKSTAIDKVWFPSSYLIYSCTGGIVSNVVMDSAVQEYMKWMDLAVKLPRLTKMEKFRYAMEILMHEACVFVLTKQFNWTREKAKSYLLDGQDYTFGLERGYRVQEIRDRLYKPNESDVNVDD